MHSWLMCLFVCRLSKDFDIDVTDIDVQVVVFKLTLFEFSNKTVRPFVLAKPTCDLIRVDPKGEFNWQL